MAEISQKKIAAVTGATGYVATEVIYQLLEKGYIVHATVRSKARSQDLVDAFSINGKPNPDLIIFEADLLKEGSFDDVFKGVNYVLHTASPFQLKVEDPQRDLVDPALIGTKNVLASVDKNIDTIKVVVVTSSIVAVFDTHNKDPSKIFTEKDWNTTSSLTDGPYYYSKYVAEKAAWDWYKGKENKLKLTTVNPGFVMGRIHLKRDDSTSIKTLASLINGDYENGAPAEIIYPTVSVRDVGEAHVKCLEDERAQGRYILSSSKSYSLLDYVAFLKDDFPNNKFPTKLIGQPTGSLIVFSSAKVEKELDIKLRDIGETIREMAQTLLKFDLVKKL